MSDRPSRPDVAELQQTAQIARDQLMRSIGRLDNRVKRMASTAVDATAASGWGIAAASALWISIAIDRPRYEAPERRRPVPSLGKAVIKTAMKAAGFVLSGVLMYSFYRRARRLADAPQPAKQLPASTAAPIAVTHREPRIEA